MPAADVSTGDPLGIGPAPRTWRRTVSAWLRAAPRRTRSAIASLTWPAWVLIAAWAAGAAALGVAGVALGEEGRSLRVLAVALAGIPFLMALTTLLVVLSVLLHVFAALGILIALEWLVLRLIPARRRVARRGRRPPRSSGARGPDPLGYYALLALDPRASARMARLAYRRAALRHHPDLGGDVTRMAAINRAWEVIGDPAARSAYDAGAASCSEWG